VRSRPPPAETPALGAPLFVLNLKAYPSCLGARATTIGSYLEELGRSAGVPVAIAPAMSDLAELASALRIPVLAQHTDPGDAGARTGFVPVEAVLAAGARGSLVNHSEHPLPPDEVAEVAGRLSALGLAAVVCARDATLARRLAASRPPYLAVEPPDLIGGDRAVSTARPEVVSETVEAVRGVSPNSLVLCGAGIHDRRDVARALELGSRGILVASAVTLAKSPREAIAELLAGF
jgi:triosephosphate isomerase (TIM)